MASTSKRAVKKQRTALQEELGMMLIGIPVVVSCMCAQEHMPNGTITAILPPKKVPLIACSLQWNVLITPPEGQGKPWTKPIASLLTEWQQNMLFESYFGRFAKPWFLKRAP